MYNPLTMPPRKKRASELGAVLHRVTPDSVRDSLAKTARVVFQISPAEKREIQETASGFSMTMSEYLVQVHRLFRRLTGGKTPKSVVKGRRDLN
jgi:hypothetical protein